MTWYKGGVQEPSLANCLCKQELAFLSAFLLPAPSLLPFPHMTADFTSEIQVVLTELKFSVLEHVFPKMFDPMLKEMSFYLYINKSY